MDTNDQHALRVLVCSLLVRDSELTAGVLKTAGLAATVCSSLPSLRAEIAAGAGAVLLGAEALVPSLLPELKAQLAVQPAWSDLPFIVLTGQGGLGGGDGRDQAVFEALRNVTFLERPVRIMTMVSCVRSALAARERQYEVRDLVADLDRSRVAAEAASRSKSSFLANMSHEIRTPLGIIMGCSDLLTSDGVMESEKRSYIQAIRRNGDDLLRLIDELLDLSKVEAGHLDFETVPLSLAELFADIKATFADRAADKGLCLQVTVDEALPPWVASDPLRLRQILKNLLSNALKFTTSGHIELTASVRDTADAGKLLMFAVADTGCGISPDERQRLFQPFMQADSSTTRKYGGTGLGLALSRRLARALGGDVVLESSEVGSGSTFVASVALQAADDPATTGTAVSEAEPNDKLLAGLRVLLVDDAPDNQMLVGHLLRRRGIAVDLADNGAVAVQKAGDSPYDLILMDVQMPVLDGYGATRELRRRGFSQPILALSAHAMAEERAKSLAAGCDEHLTKPINFGRLLKSIVLHTAGVREEKEGLSAR